MGRGRSRSGRGTDGVGLLLVLLPWALLGGSAGCLGQSHSPPGPLCPGTVSGPASANTNHYQYEYPGSVVDARGVDWTGQETNGIQLEGSQQGCFQGGSVTGTWDPAAPWETYHLTAALSVRADKSPMRVMSFHARNYGDGVSIEPYVPCPNGSLSPWLYVRASHLEDLHDDAIESDGLCAVEIADNLFERVYVAFAFRNRASEPNLFGRLNTVIVDGNLVRLHSFPNNWAGTPGHNGFWKWAREARGPAIVVRNNLFLAFDAPPNGGLLPYVNRVQACENNVLLFAGTEAEWAEALAGGCDDEGDDGLCEGERLLALSHCYSLITKPDSQSEAAFLAHEWDPHVASWKAAHTADDE